MDNAPHSEHYAELARMHVDAVTAIDKAIVLGTTMIGVLVKIEAEAHRADVQLEDSVDDLLAFMRDAQSAQRTLHDMRAAQNAFFHSPARVGRAVAGEAAVRP